MIGDDFDGETLVDFTEEEPREETAGRPPIEVLQHEVATLKYECHDLEDRLKVLQHKLEKKSVILCEQMIATGIERVRVTTEYGAMTLFPSSRRFVYKRPGVEKENYLKVLSGLEDFYDLVTKTANANSVTARANEIIQSGRDLPSEFAEVAEVKVTMALGTRR